MSMGYISKMDDYNKASQCFVISDGVLLKYSGNDTIVNIPSSVVRIAANAFESRLDVIEITIPDSVKDIESFAFVPCKSLKVIKFGFGIQVIPFGCCRSIEHLETIVITDNVKLISGSAFQNCTSLRNVEVLTKTYRPPITAEEKGYAFEKQLMGGSPLIEEVVTNNDALSLISIGGFAFEGCSLIDESFWIAHTKTVANRAFSSGHTNDQRDYSVVNNEQTNAPKIDVGKVRRKSVEDLLGGTRKNGPSISIEAFAETEGETVQLGKKEPDTLVGATEGKKEPPSAMPDITVLDETPDIVIPEACPKPEEVCADKSVDTRDSKLLSVGFYVEDGLVFGAGTTKAKPDIEIEDLGMSSQVVMALHRMRKDHMQDNGRMYISDALQLTTDGLKYIAGNRITIEEIKKEFVDKVAEYLLRDDLKVIEDVKNQCDMAASTVLEEHREASSEIPTEEVLTTNVVESVVLYPGFEVEGKYIRNIHDGAIFADVSFEELGLSIRSLNALHREGLFKLSHLLPKTEAQLYRMKNMGRKSVDEIIEAATKYLSNGEITSKPVIRAIASYDIKDSNIVHVDSGDVVADVAISALGLSVRPFGSLIRAGISTISQIIPLSREELLDLPNMGAKSVAEILEIVPKYLEQHRKDPNDIDAEENTTIPLSDDAYLPDIDPNVPVLAPDFAVVEGRVLHRDTLCEIADRPIAVLSLSVRATNCLQKSNKVKLSDLVGMTFDELRKIRNMGALSVNEISEKLELYLSKAVASSDDEGNTTQIILQSKCTASKLLSVFSKTPFAKLPLNEICGMLPDDMSKDSIEETITMLLNSGHLLEEDEKYFVVYSSIWEYIKEKIETLPKTDNEYRLYEVLQERIGGKTLEEVGAQHGLTRERIRQIEKKTIRKIENSKVIFDEDRYKDLYTSYLVEKEFFVEYLGDSKLWNYLLIRYQHGDRNIEESLEDKRITPEVRRLVEHWIYRNYIEVDGVRVPAQRSEIEDFVAEQYCKDEVTLEEFFNLYERFLQECDVTDERLAITDQTRRTRGNRLADSMKILWKHNQRLRYYEIASGDYTELLEALNLAQFDNVDISTRKFIVEYPELMERYDIRDEYELHNLLKKIHAEQENPEMRFGRMPNLHFGVFDCEASVKEMLFTLAPIGINEFAEALSAEYGHRKDTVMANWLQCISEYYHQGVYSVDYEVMPDEQMTALKAHLLDDFYYLSEVKKIYQRNVPNADLSLLTTFNLKRMGFLVGTSYVIQNHPTAEAYFESLLLTKDIIDVAPISKRYTGLTTYSVYLSGIKRERKIIEFEPYQYINVHRLNKLGIEMSALCRYCDEVWSFLTDDTYFSIQSIRAAGFEAELDSLGFGDLFYASLLKEDGRFSWQRAGNAVIFSPIKRNFSVHDFLVALIKQAESIDIDEFVELLNGTYGAAIDRSSVLQGIKGSDIYYDKIMEKLYANYDIYFEEI